MHIPSLSIARISIICSIVCCAFVSASSFTNPTTEFSISDEIEMLTIANDTNDNIVNSRDRSTLAVREEAPRDGATFVSTMCESLPDVCKKMRQIKDHFFPDTGKFEARGPRDMIAIISTILASLLGAILVKLNVLIVLSLISVGIGKLLLLLLALKTKLFSTDNTHQHHPPFVYEKVYYPHHHHHHQDVPDQQIYPSEMFQEYSPSMYS